jgi:hypothetical protein
MGLVVASKAKEARMKVERRYDFMVNRTEN